MMLIPIHTIHGSMGEFRYVHSMLGSKTSTFLQILKKTEILAAFTKYRNYILYIDKLGHEHIYIVYSEATSVVPMFFNI